MKPAPAAASPLFKSFKSLKPLKPFPERPGVKISDSLVAALPR
jgi:hypothetical protein